MKKHLFPLILYVLMAGCGSNDTSADVATVTAKDSAVRTDTITELLPDTVVAVPPGKEVKELELKFNLRRGKSYSYVMNFDIEQDMEGRKMKTSMNWKYGMQVTEDNGKVRTLKTTYDRIAMSMDMGGQRMEFSSDKPPGDASNPLNIVSNMFAAIKGKSFIMKVDDKGEIKDVEGFDKIGEAIVKEMNVPEEARERALQNFKTQFNDKDVIETFAQAFNIFPEKKIRVGDSWEKENVTKMGPTQAKMTTTYTVKQITADRVLLDAVSKVSTGRDGSTGTQKSKLVVDPATGLVLQNIFEMKMEGTNNMQTKGKIIGKEL